MKAVVSLKQFQASVSTWGFGLCMQRASQSPPPSVRKGPVLLLFVKILQVLAHLDDLGSHLKQASSRDERNLSLALYCLPEALVEGHSVADIGSD